MDDDEREVQMAIHMIYHMHKAASTIQKAFRAQRWILV